MEVNRIFIQLLVTDLRGCQFENSIHRFVDDVLIYWKTLFVIESVNFLPRCKSQINFEQNKFPKEILKTELCVSLMMSKGTIFIGLR